MGKIVKIVWNCTQTLFFIHGITLLLFILNKYAPLLILVLEEYLRRLLEITVWPVLDFFWESRKKKGWDAVKEEEDMIWDTGWQPHRTTLWNIGKLIRVLTCLIFLPQYHSPVSLSTNTLINDFFNYLRCVYHFLTFERFIYIYLVAFFANRFRSGPIFIRLKNSLTGGPCRKTNNNSNTGDASTSVLSSASQSHQNHNHSDDSSIVTDDDDDRSSPLMVSSLGSLLPPRRRRRSHIERMCHMCSHLGDHSVLLPCGHTDLCFNCSASYHSMDLACPFCATHIRSCHRILL